MQCVRPVVQKKKQNKKTFQRVLFFLKPGVYSKNEPRTNSGEPRARNPGETHKNNSKV